MASRDAVEDVGEAGVVRPPGCGCMTYTTIRYGVAEGVATIMLARPDKLNAVSAAMHADLRQALAAAEADAAVRCLVLTGDGRAFSSGQDLTEERLPGLDGKIDFGGGRGPAYKPLGLLPHPYPQVTVPAPQRPAVRA